MQVTPAILPHTFEEITEKVTRIDGLLSKIQIDLCDGVFGREKTWLPAGDEILPSGFAYEFDMMVDDWRTYIPRAVALGAKCIVAHVDFFTDEDLVGLVGMVSPQSLGLGISVSNDKSVDFHADMVRKVRDLYPHIYIQVMGIKNIGEQAQLFDETTPERVKLLKQQFGDINVQVDGGIKPDTAKLVVSSGADTVVVGSYVFGSSDVSSSLESLNASCE